MKNYVSLVCAAVRSGRQIRVHDKETELLLLFRNFRDAAAKFGKERSKITEL